MTNMELLDPTISYEYTIAVTRDNKQWFTMGWYTSIKKCAAAWMNKPYPPRWDEYKEIKLIKRKIQTTAEFITEDLTKYGIK